MLHRKSHTTGFTFIEIMVVILIIAIIATIVAAAIQYVRITSRDTRRISDINQIRSALNLYYSKYSQYPTAITPGQSFQVNGITYLSAVPSNPLPRTDNGCANKEYEYTQTSAGISYTLSFCLGYAQNTISGGAKIAIPEGILP